MMTREQDTRIWYQRYYAQHTGVGRNDLRSNPGVLFQILATEASIVLAVRAMTHDPATARVLDVGCGTGGDLFAFIRLGYRPGNITGVDILPERIAQATDIHAHAHFIEGDASRLGMPDGIFDLVFESTMFATLPDNALRAAIAQEMIRVCNPGGYLFLIDWRTPKPGDRHYKALSRRELCTLFGVGHRTQLVGMFRGALVPPIGRFLSTHVPSCYFLFAALFPCLVGQVVWLLRKTDTTRETDGRRETTV
jgi:SAM-dependent methyltransferase